MARYPMVPVTSGRVACLLYFDHDTLSPTMNLALLAVPQVLFSFPTLTATFCHSRNPSQTHYLVLRSLPDTNVVAFSPP